MRDGNRTEPPVNSTVQQETVPPTTAKVVEDRYSIPKRLVIPKINVDTAISQMGLTEAGDMEAPQTDHESGWYKYGPQPGNVGSAVIAGHLGADSQAVFSQLGSLVKGDTISVTDDRDQTVTFVVTGTRTYSNDASPSEVFVSTSGTHLNLITCEGDWVTDQATYSDRLVVFADKVE